MRVPRARTAFGPGDHGPSGEFLQKHFPTKWADMTPWSSHFTTFLML